MKKKVGFILFAFLSLELFAFENLEVKISPEAGLLDGIVKEYVLLNNITDELYEYSRLDWDIKNVQYWGLTNEYTIKDKVYLGISGRYGMPGFSGKMIDNDWLNEKYYPDYAYQTNYSIHDCYLNHFWNGKISLGYLYKNSESVKIMPRISFQYQDIFFTGKHGLGIYGESRNGVKYPYNDEDLSHIKIHDYSDRERVITYRQLQFISFAGIDFSFEWSSGFGISFLTEISPFACILANDTHYASDLYVGVTGNGKYLRDFLDITKGFGICNLEMDASYKLNRTNRLDFILTGFFMPQLIGPSAMKQIASGQYVYPDSVTLGGTAMQYFSCAVKYTLSF